jgi:uncharacterized protein (TIGR02145 family)
MKDLLKFVLGILIILLIQSCKKEVVNVIKDIDGNVYTAVTIGTQVWMVENLKTTRYRNGDLIGTTTPATLDISSEPAPKYQWAYVGNENNVATYGRLYTWYAIADIRNVCPTGWHVPTDAEWTILATTVGGESVAGGKLKEAGTSHWYSPNTGATNEYSFTALPGGVRYDNSTFSSILTGGGWWSYTDINASISWYRGMYYASSNVIRESYGKAIGFSVRCIKDN